MSGDAIADEQIRLIKENLDPQSERLKELRELREQDGDEFSAIINSVYGVGDDVSMLSTLLYGLNDNIEDLGYLWVKQDLESYIEGLMRFRSDFVSIFIRDAHNLFPHAQKSLTAILSHILETPTMLDVFIKGIRSGRLNITAPVNSAMRALADNGSKQAAEALALISNSG